MPFCSLSIINHESCEILGEKQQSAAFSDIPEPPFVSLKQMVVPMEMYFPLPLS